MGAALDERPAPLFVTPQEFAARTGLPVSLVRAMARDGRLPRVPSRHVYIPLEDGIAALRAAAAAKVREPNAAPRAYRGPTMSDPRPVPPRLLGPQPGDIAVRRARGASTPKTRPGAPAESLAPSPEGLAPVVGTAAGEVVLGHIPRRGRRGREG